MISINQVARYGHHRGDEGMPHRSLSRIVAAAVVVALMAPACSGGSGSSSSGAASSTSTTGEPAVYPTASWTTGDPAEAGFDPARLEAIAAEAEQNQSNCLVVIRHGRLVAEWYWNGTDATSSQEVFSATKSVSSTLVGIAQADGALDVGDPASDYISEWGGTPSAEVTVENLLSNDSGRHWDLTTDYRDLVSAADRTGFAVGLTQDSPPGTTWAYNNAAIQTLDAVLTEATGQPAADYAAERLLGPLGMTQSEMTRDAAGNTNLFFGLHSTCQDMARFGYLFLRGGNWDGEQIVPEEWVEAATGQSSQELNAAYGYLWWLNRRGPLGSPMQATTGQAGGDVREGQLVPGAPADMFWARGLGGQIVQVDPGSDTVVVRLGAGQAYDSADTAKVVTEALVDR